MKSVTLRSNKKKGKKKERKKVPLRTTIQQLNPKHDILTVYVNTIEARSSGQVKNEVSAIHGDIIKK